MIFYFSGTGNSRWAAQQLASYTGDTVCDLARMDNLPDLQGESRIGLVFPVYAWGPPQMVMEFAQNLPRTGAFTFGVGTCGSEAGLALKKLAAVYPLDSSYSLVMPKTIFWPRTWRATAPSGGNWRTPPGRWNGWPKRFWPVRRSIGSKRGPWPGSSRGW